MKLIRFSRNDGPISFGIVIGDRAVAFIDLQQKSGIDKLDLSNSQAYLTGLPESEQVARKLLDWGQSHLDQFDLDKVPKLQDVRLHAPLDVASLFDFGLTPRHLRNSLETMIKYEKGNPQTAPLLEAFGNSLLAKPANQSGNQPERLSYYKCNMNSIVGDDEVIPWPLYTSRLDIEPELAVVYGNAKQPVAGFCIFNDISARDVQAPEIIGGFCLTKDMDKGNQLGPYLVTPDEIGNPYDLKVVVTVNGQIRYQGTTKEITHRAEDVFAWLSFIGTIKSGTVIGFGTIPDCTGLDHDDFIEPNAKIEISFEKLGVLRCLFSEPKGKLLPSRWPQPAALKKFSPL